MDPGPLIVTHNPLQGAARRKEENYPGLETTGFTPTKMGVEPGSIGKEKDYLGGSPGGGRGG